MCLPAKMYQSHSSHKHWWHVPAKKKIITKTRLITMRSQPNLIFMYYYKCSLKWFQKMLHKVLHEKNLDLLNYLIFKGLIKILLEVALEVLVERSSRGSRDPPRGSPCSWPFDACLSSPAQDPNVAPWRESKRTPA